MPLNGKARKCHFNVICMQQCIKCVHNNNYKYDFRNENRFY